MGAGRGRGEGGGVNRREELKITNILKVFNCRSKWPFEYFHKICISNLKFFTFFRGAIRVVQFNLNRLSREVVESFLELFKTLLDEILDNML